MSARRIQHGPPRRDTLSLAEARAVALAAQGFGSPRPTADVGAAALCAMVRRLGVLQIDSVNVLVRSHYLPIFSRLGPYPRPLLDDCVYGGRRRPLFEYWAHEASIVPVDAYRLFRWRMERAKAGVGTWKHVAALARDKPAVVAEVLREITDRGPLRASDLSLGERAVGPWWGWSEAKRALEYLFWSGRVTTATRRSFERVYDLVERVLPERVWASDVLDVPAQQRELVMRAARALGAATARDLRDYYRLPPAEARLRVAELVEQGALRPVTVEGWKDVAYVDAKLRAAPRVEARALLSPFDSLVWDRARTERLFGFRFRLEIYTPAHRRVHGYYVLPFLLGDRLVARVDLKSDRERRVLLVQGVHLEPGVPRTEVRAALRAELGLLAQWLGLERVVART
jgi:uncharacterized protein